MAKPTHHQNVSKKLEEQQQEADRELRRQQIRATKQKTSRIKQKNDRKPKKK